MAVEKADESDGRTVDVCCIKDCGCQATKELEIPVGCGGKAGVEIYPVCEKHYLLAE